MDAVAAVQGLSPSLTALMRFQETKAFWLPSKAPEARDTIAKPDMLTYCPASNKKLKLKDLIPVKFTRVPEGQTGYAMDPVTGDTFTNANKLVLLRPTGTSSELVRILNLQ